MHGSLIPRRSLDVSVRIWDDGALLIETLIGRYVLNGAGRTIWRHIDGVADVDLIVSRVADHHDAEAVDVSQPVTVLLERLVELRLIDVVEGAKSDGAG